MFAIIRHAFVSHLSDDFQTNRGRQRAQHFGIYEFTVRHEEIERLAALNNIRVAPSVETAPAPAPARTAAAQQAEAEEATDEAERGGFFGEERRRVKTGDRPQSAKTARPSSARGPGNTDASGLANTANAKPKAMSARGARGRS